MNYYALLSENEFKAITTSEKRYQKLKKRFKTAKSGVFKSRKEAEAFVNLKPTPTTNKATKSQCQRNSDPGLPAVHIYFHFERVPFEKTTGVYGAVIKGNDKTREVTDIVHGNTPFEMELAGLIDVLYMVKEPSLIIIYTSSDRLSTFLKTRCFKDYPNTLSGSVRKKVIPDVLIIYELKAMLKPHKLEVRKLKKMRKMKWMKQAKILAVETLNQATKPIWFNFVHKASSKN